MQSRTASSIDGYHAPGGDKSPLKHVNHSKRFSLDRAMGYIVEDSRRRVRNLDNVSVTCYHLDMTDERKITKRVYAQQGIVFEVDITRYDKDSSGPFLALQVKEVDGKFAAGCAVPKIIRER